MTVHVSGGYMTVHVCGGYMTVHVWRLHDCTFVSGGALTVRVRVESTRLYMCELKLHDCTCVGGYMTVHVCVEAVWRLHDCTCVCGGYMTVHGCVEAT